eukprot:COSAG05_NODE_3488_length_2030_cov_3.309684_4_plen_75_part_00
MRTPPLGIVPLLEYVLNDAPGSAVSPPRAPMGGGAFIVALREHYLRYACPYLPIAKRSVDGSHVPGSMRLVGSA